MEDKNVVAIKEETFNEIKIYGFGIVDSFKPKEIIVKLDDGRRVSVQNVVALNNWVDYVNERDAKVTVVK